MSRKKINQNYILAILLLIVILLQFNRNFREGKRNVSRTTMPTTDLVSGSYCTNNSQCRSGTCGPNYITNYNACSGGLDEYCTRNEPCATGLTCRNKKCRPSSSSPSSSSTSSSSTKNIGVECSNRFECSTGVCELGICKQYTGGRCNNNKDCTSTDFCTAGYCQKKFVKGKTCDSNDFCESNKCYNQTCQ